MAEPELWLRGPLPGIPKMLQPVAHALLQAREEVNLITANFPDALLWNKPAGVASVGFHLQHLAGVIDRLFTYARGESLSQEQKSALAAESRPSTGIHVQELVHKFNVQVDKAIYLLGVTEEQTLAPRCGEGKASFYCDWIALSCR